MYSKYRSAFSFSHTILCMLKKCACDIWNYCHGMSSAPWQEEECIWISARNGCWATSILKKVAYGIDHSQSSCECMMWIGSSFATEWEACFFSISVLSDFMALELFFLTSISRKSVQFRSHFIYCNLLFVLQSSSPRYYLSWMWHPPHSISDPLIDSFQFHFISFSRVDSNTTNMEFRTLKLAKQTHPVTQNITIFFFIFRNHNDHAMQKSIE